MNGRLKIAFISTYVPKECGIATFTNDIVKNLFKSWKIRESQNKNITVVAVSDQQNYLYPAEVKFEIMKEEKLSYINAAKFLNNSNVDVVNIQHEFGIFGGIDGNFILDTVKNLRKPIVTTLHTVIEKPSKEQKYIIAELGRKSIYLVVLAKKAIELLKNIYNIPEEKIVYIEHGAPDVPFLDSSYYKGDLNAQGKKIILTFGLINSNKGIEYGIKATSIIAKKYPNIVYVILGITHPEVKKVSGESYRISLELLVKKLGIEKNVEFFNYFVEKEELIKFLVASDFYLTPYLSKEQIASGTLTYALTCGKVLISTPYWYAEELLGQERGILVPFRDEKSIADNIIKLLEDETKFSQYRKNAYDFGRNFIWENVVQKYEKKFWEAITRQRKLKAKIDIEYEKKKSILPEINLNFFKILTDDTGIIQFSKINIPDRKSGYTTDDNTRALIVAIKDYNNTKNNEMLSYITKFLSFVHYSYDEQSERVRNFLNYKREWTDKKISEDTVGRVIWSLGYLIKHSPNNSLHIFALELFKKIINNVMHFTSPRAWAFITLGGIFYLSIYKGDIEIKKICENMINRIYKQFKDNSDKNWIWLEDILSYENARIPQALITYGGFFENEKIFSIGEKSLKWLIDLQYDKKNDRLSLIGNKRWLKRGEKKSQFDQQPVEIAALSDAIYEVYKYTQNEYYEKVMSLCINWFLGDNDVGEPLYDFTTGGTRDGIHPLGINLNQGAESTLSYLLTLYRLYDFQQLKIRDKEKFKE